jgi:hypothetical protein
MAAEGRTARCRAVRAVASRIGRRRGRVRGSGGGAEAMRATCVVPGSSAGRAGRRHGEVPEVVRRQVVGLSCRWS